jgi:hypothetical protein
MARFLKKMYKILVAVLRIFYLVDRLITYEDCVK